ncbi:AraC family transcriptional regulator [Pseudobutyrivibrio sp.]|jgi:AraC-like DNA-binding protein|uniref:AraC family transcriptional regulator n=1 Tax=Pseudobutyrivibrio sp. TaxID=2014367 RepID=UPI001E1909D1|nr:AraC family transcriptional regulator [Pseudobutyrivibrio sp.]MBE5910073.1 AraC family transcriptional regulator [Pseudobutyrivibrio sp.]
MKYIDYQEHRQHGTFNFPIAHYRETPRTPRYLMTYHWHTNYEIVFIREGSFTLTLDDNTQTYHAGDVIFISDGMLHGGTPMDCIYDCIVFDLQMLLKNNNACSKTVQDIISHKIRINSFLSENNRVISAIVQDLCNTLSEKGDGYEFKVQGYLYILFGEIIQSRLYTKSTIDNITSERLNSIKEVLQYISENYSNNINLDSLAHIAGMNPKYFCRYFKSMTERTPIDYLNYYRIECACEMLSTKDVSIREVAISCGFNDESYFIKTFHKYKDITPKQFIKQEF